MLSNPNGRLDLPRFRGEVSVWDQGSGFGGNVSSLSCFLGPSFGSAGSIFSSRPARRKPLRAGAVKVGRRADLASHCDISRPDLDRPEHGGRMVCAGIRAPSTCCRSNSTGDR